jgi:hemerythrin-like domain-containing protein
MNMQFDPNTTEAIEPEIEINMEGGISPYAPPDAYDPPSKEEDIPYEDLHPFLQELIDEHNEYTKELNAFEATIAMIEGGKIDREINDRLMQFFTHFDDQIVKHNLEEERYLFSRISKKMKANGEHSQADENYNVIDVLEDDHVKSIQMASVAFNMFALFSRIPDEKSRYIILDVALNQAKELLELLKVHIYREDTIIFPYAQKNFSDAELTEIQQKTKGE